LINNQQIIIQYDERQRYVDVVIWIKEIWICIAYNLLLTLQLSLNIFNVHMGFTCAHVANIIDMNCLEMVYKVVRCASDAKFWQLCRYN
jgi:exoribonuclease II